MATEREQDAVHYLQEHKITELMNNLTSLLLYHRPEKPRDFLISELKKLKIARVRNMDFPCLFDESNLDAIFGILDPTHQGYITVAQYKEALKTLGIDSFNNFPPGADENRIALETFKKEARTGLMKTCATFKPL
ncbi:EF-hand calcium-binding domain-containing protein 10 isoform X2 [Latimeria chalumnae]|uniref:EF-hand calcium-binding domain-containing protein 10 isoform X2 n=1 Tax=Latimeria chalumnae TaxID=7897 RepID=UPI00313C336D